jgi:hypothetical protein
MNKVDPGELADIYETGYPDRSGRTRRFLGHERPVEQRLRAHHLLGEAVEQLDRVA